MTAVEYWRTLEWWKREDERCAWCRYWRDGHCSIMIDRGLRYTRRDGKHLCETPGPYQVNQHFRPNKECERVLLPVRAAEHERARQRMINDWYSESD